MDLRLLEHQPTLVGKLVRLEPMGPEHFEGLWPMFADEEGRSSSDPMAQFTREQVRLGMARAREQSRAFLLLGLLTVAYPGKSLR